MSPQNFIFTRRNREDEEHASSKVVFSCRPLRTDRFGGDRDLDSPLFKPNGRRSEEEYEALRRSLGLPTLADRYITDLCGLQHSRFVASKVFFTCSKREDEEEKDEQARPGE